MVGPVRNWRLRHAVLKTPVGISLILAMKAPSSSGLLRYLEYTLVLYSVPRVSLWCGPFGLVGKKEEDVGNEHVH